MSFPAERRKEAMERQFSYCGSWGDKPFGEPMGKVFIPAATADGKKVVVEVSRDNISGPLKLRVIPGRVKYRVKTLEPQMREIIGQIRHDFKKLGPVSWKPDIDLFLRFLQIIFSEEKTNISKRIEKNLAEMLERDEVILSEKRNEFWVIPDKFFLDPVRYF
jgi:hypothetical protein